MRTLWRARFGRMIYRLAMKLRWLLLLTVTLFFAACAEHNVMLDNPRDTGVTFTFDEGDSHEVAAGALKKITLPEGNHHVVIKTDDGTQIGDTTFKLREGGLIHSGSSTYVVWRQLYGLQTERETLLNERWVEFDSIRAKGDLKVYQPNWLYVEKNWEKGLDEELPGATTLYITKDYVIESKIFRSKEFIETYRNMAKKSKDN